MFRPDVELRGWVPSDEGREADDKANQNVEKQHDLAVQTEC
jgi:hypothetical protein